MNLFAARLALRPRSLTEVLDLAAPFCLANARLLGRLALVSLAPLAVLAGALRMGLRWEWLGIWWTLVPLAWLSTGLFTAGLGDAMFHDPDKVSARAVVARFLRRLPAQLLVKFVRVLVLLSCASGVVPLLLEGPRWLFPIEATLLEKADLGAAISRSRSLGRRRAGFCLGLGVALLALPVLTVVLAEAVGGMLIQFVFQLGEPFGSLWKQGGSGFAVLGLLLAVPLAASMRFLGYIDLRTRSEGWDLQLRFAAWAERERDQPMGPGRHAA